MYVSVCARTRACVYVCVCVRNLGGEKQHNVSVSVCVRSRAITRVIGQSRISTHLDQIDEFQVLCNLFKLALLESGLAWWM